MDGLLAHSGPRILKGRLTERKVKKLSHSSDRTSKNKASLPPWTLVRKQVALGAAGHHLDTEKGNQPEDETDTWKAKWRGKK